MRWDTERIERNLATLQFPSVGDECGFSWHSCWTCERPLGGTRHELNYVGEDGQIYNEEICIDCVLYIANGDLPEDENQ